MDEREIWVRGVATLKALMQDDLVLARAMRGRDYGTLLAAGTVARRGVGEAMAITDPGLYVTLRGAITLMNVKGYGRLDLDRLRKLADAGREVRRAPTAGGGPEGARISAARSRTAR